jgi:hypothetical protein
MPGLPGAGGTDQGRPTPIPIAAGVTCDRCPISDQQESYEALYKKALPPPSILKSDKSPSSKTTEVYNYDKIHIENIMIITLSSNFLAVTLFSYHTC